MIGRCTAKHKPCCISEQSTSYVREKFSTDWCYVAPDLNYASCIKIRWHVEFFSPYVRPSATWQVNVQTKAEARTRIDALNKNDVLSSVFFI